MKSKNYFRVISLLVLMISFFPVSPSAVHAAAPIPPADMFQLPWEQGLAWVSLDTFDNGFKRLPDSPHNYLNGGAVDFAPRRNMKVGEDTSRYWVTAAAAGTVVEMTSCSLKINHGNGWITDYQFLANFQVKLGDVVYRNQRLAVIADGLRTKFCPPALEPDIPHLHFSLRPEMRDATFAGWTVNYNPLFNRTTFKKGDVTAYQYQPLLNIFDSLQIISRGPLAWDTTYTGSVDTYRYERWSLALGETAKFTLTATPATPSLIPMLVLLDANGTEIARGSGTLTTTQSAGNYFVQVQPQVANGFFSLIAHREDIPVPTGPYVSTTVTPAGIDVGGTAQATVSLHNVPAEGYTSAEFTCTYNAGLAEVGNIVIGNLFGVDAASAINGPQNGSFIAAIAGSTGNKAAASGPAFTFGVKGLQAGQTPLECKARVSKGDNMLTNIEWLGTRLNIGNIPMPTPTPPPMDTPMPTFTPTPIGSAAPTAVQTSTPSGSPTSTPIGSPVPTFTSTPVETPTPIFTFTPTPSPDGFVIGRVISSKVATVGLYDSSGTLVISGPTANEGSFQISAPAWTYTLVAVASGFLSARGSVTLISGSSVTKPTVTLPAGDIDNNNVIDQFDAMTIGMAYNTSTPAAADLNNDGIINVLDLELLAKNYRKTGPVPWQ